MEPGSLKSEAPLCAERLLMALAPPGDRDALAGDLFEEFAADIVPVYGAMRARWWYRWQVMRSLAPLAIRSWERASLLRASAAITAAAAIGVVPAVLLLALRTFVLQQVPLKTTAELSPAFAALLAVVGIVAISCAIACAVTLLNGAADGGAKR